jgi:hypothetical protein
MLNHDKQIFTAELRNKFNIQYIIELRYKYLLYFYDRALPRNYLP